MRARTTSWYLGTAWAVLPVLAMAWGCGPAGPTVAYVETLGNDTMSIETFRRTDTHIEGQLLTRTPATQLTAYAADLDASGMITRLSVQTTTPAENPGGPPPSSAVVTMEGESAVMIRTRERTDTATLEVPAGTVPVVARVPLPMGFLQYAIDRAEAAGGDSLAFPFVTPTSRRPTADAVLRSGPQRFTMNFFGTPTIDVQVDADGKVVSVSGERTTRKVEIRPADAAAIDVAALAADYATRDAEGRGLGVPSPRDQVHAEGGGAEFDVDYSRPAMRGRTILGGLMPFDTIWRTGANAATQFTTSRPIRAGQARVPAGSYTLWTTFGRDSSGTLVINKQTGQWGTQYDSTQDLVRVPMTRTTLDQPVERFTIAIEPTPTGGVLRMSWDRTEFSVPLRVGR